MAGKYRLVKPTLGAVAATHLATTVPEGSILEIPKPPLAGDRTVELFWNGKAMVMFVRDLTQRANKLDTD
jgi:hypothetical protein